MEWNGVIYHDFCVVLIPGVVEGWCALDTEGKAAANYLREERKQELGSPESAGSALQHALSTRKARVAWSLRLPDVVRNLDIDIVKLCRTTKSERLASDTNNALVIEKSRKIRSAVGHGFSKRRIILGL